MGPPRPNAKDQRPAQRVRCIATLAVVFAPAFGCLACPLVLSKPIDRLLGSRDGPLGSDGVPAATVRVRAAAGRDRHGVPGKPPPLLDRVRAMLALDRVDDRATPKEFARHRPSPPPANAPDQ